MRIEELPWVKMDDDVMGTARFAEIGTSYVFHLLDGAYEVHPWNPHNSDVLRFNTLEFQCWLYDTFGGKDEAMEDQQPAVVTTVSEGQ